MATDRLPEALRPIIALDRADLHTTYPAEVLSYDLAAQTVTLRLGVREVLEAPDDDDPDTVTAYPDIRGVPVAFPSAGAWHLSFPLPVGATGALVCTASDLSKWTETGQVSDPGVNARHGLGGFFVPGLRHSRNALPRGAGYPTDVLSLGYDGGAMVRVKAADVTITADTNIQGVLAASGSSESAALASKVAIELAAIAASITALNAGGAPVVYTPAPAGVGSSYLKSGG